MHELSLIASLFEIVVEKANVHKAREVTLVTIKVGPLSGVVPELLESAFEMYKKETIAGRARLVIEKTPFALRCRACETETTRDNPVSACPGCGSADFAIIQGTEVFLDKLELEID
jgi:hydrogenase nickel incorporation protein HypA/HybF